MNLVILSAKLLPVHFDRDHASAAALEPRVQEFPQAYPSTSTLLVARLSAWSLETRLNFCLLNCWYVFTGTITSLDLPPLRFLRALLAKRSS